MKQTITIDVPEGKKAVWKDGKIEYEDLPLPKTWEEFCSMNPRIGGEAYIDTTSTIREVHTSSDDRHLHDDRNLLPSKEAAEAHLALMQLHQLRDYYRQGWKPNCFGNNYFYFVNRYYNLSKQKYVYVISTKLHTDYFLSFQTEELAKEFLNNFRELIEKAGDLI